MDKYYLITFENTHGAMNGEEILKNNHIRAIVLPTPTYITKSCGISLRVFEEDLEKVKALIKEEKMKIKLLYLKEGNNYSIIEI